MIGSSLQTSSQVSKFTKIAHYSLSALKTTIKGEKITVARIYSPHVIKKGVSRSIKMGQMQKKKEYYVNYIIFRTQRK